MIDAHIPLDGSLPAVTHYLKQLQESQAFNWHAVIKARWTQSSEIYA